MQFDIVLSGIEIQNDYLSEWNLNQHYPNPFNGRTHIKYSMARFEFVTIHIFSINGKRTKTLVNAFKNSGIYQTMCDGDDEPGNKVTSGIYFYQMICGTYRETRRLLYLK